jgi:hypothetical protein
LDDRLTAGTLDKEAGLAARDFDLGAAAELNVQATPGSHIDLLHEFEIDNLLPVRAKEQLRIEPLLQVDE